MPKTVTFDDREIELVLEGLDRLNEELEEDVELYEDAENDGTFDTLDRIAAKLS